MVRRLDPVWGDRIQAATANADTFHYTHAAPQMDILNQGKKLWLGLEDFLLGHAKLFERKLSLFTGPVLEDSDPTYRGTKIPLRFWNPKVSASSSRCLAHLHAPARRPGHRRDDDDLHAPRPAAQPPAPAVSSSP